jgi:hypothetical protein
LNSLRGDLPLADQAPPPASWKPFVARRESGGAASSISSLGRDRSEDERDRVSPTASAIFWRALLDLAQAADAPRARPVADPGLAGQRLMDIAAR